MHMVQNILKYNAIWLNNSLKKSQKTKQKEPQTKMNGKGNWKYK